MRIICPDCKQEWPRADFQPGGRCPNCGLSVEDLENADALVGGLALAGKKGKP